MGGFDQYWIAVDREGRLGLFSSSKRGAIPEYGFASGSEEVFSAVYRRWIARIVPELALQSSHLAASSGGRFAVAFRDRARGEALLAGLSISSWVENSAGGAHVAFVDDVPEEDANRIVADESYHGSIATDRLAFDEAMAHSFHTYTHDYRDGATPYGYVRQRVPDLEMTADDLPADVTARFVRLDVSFAESNEIDLAVLIGVDKCLEPPSAAAPAPRSAEKPSWWRRLLSR